MLYQLSYARTVGIISRGGLQRQWFNSGWGFVYFFSDFMSITKRYFTSLLSIRA